MPCDVSSNQSMGRPRIVVLRRTVAWPYVAMLRKCQRVNVFQVRPDAQGYYAAARKTTAGYQRAADITRIHTLPSRRRRIWHGGSGCLINSRIHRRVGPGQPATLHPGVGYRTARQPGASRNHLEFAPELVQKGKAIYVSLARVDDGGPAARPPARLPSSITSAPAGSRKVVKTFFTHGREAHGLWIESDAFIAVRRARADELPNTSNAGRRSCSAFDVCPTLRPKVLSEQDPLEHMKPSSGELYGTRRASTSCT